MDKVVLRNPEHELNSLTKHFLAFSVSLKKRRKTCSATIETSTRHHITLPSPCEGLGFVSHFIQTMLRMLRQIIALIKVHYAEFAFCKHAIHTAFCIWWPRHVTQHQSFSPSRWHNEMHQTQIQDNKEIQTEAQLSADAKSFLHD